ncbi:MAG: bifunctional glycosyltransferase family 2/GtrA family protein [Negativicutes bacterium]|nr:bifunctional glycosyltransferase family 2/GtrA family protein [Negativicutes bacterium]
MEVVLIPSYEPNQHLPKLISELQQMRLECKILIVDDGSGSAYADFYRQAEAMGSIVLHHECNRGKGAALKTGFSWLVAHPEYTAVVCADSDGQHLAKDIFLCLDTVIAHQDCLVLGVRKFKGHVPLRSRIGNTITRLAFTSASGVYLRDTQTGLRAFADSMLPWLLSVKGERFEYEMNMLLEAPAKNIPFYQLEIETVYDKKNHSSHFHTFTDSIRVYLPIIKFSSASLFTAILDYSLLLAMHAGTGKLLLSVILARLCSGTLNYWLNRKFVFRHRTTMRSSLLRYIGLAVVLLSVNYLLLRLFTIQWRIPLSISKILVEAILWGFSYWIQRAFVFKPFAMQKSGD